MKKIVSILLLIVLIIAAAVPATASKLTTVKPIILEGLEWNDSANNTLIALRAAGYIAEDMGIRAPHICDPNNVFVGMRLKFRPRRASWIVNDPTPEHSKFPYTMCTWDDKEGFTMIQDHSNDPKNQAGLTVFTIPGEDMISDIYGFEVDELHICFNAETPETPKMHLVEIDIKLKRDGFDEKKLRQKLGRIYGTQDYKYTDAFDDDVWIWKGKEKTALFMDANELVFVSLPGLLHPDKIK